MKKVLLLHRSTACRDFFNPGTFFARNDVGFSYGDYLHEVRFSFAKPANDKMIKLAAKELDLEKRGAQAYEYLSPGLMDAFVSETDVEKLIAVLVLNGYDCARVRDFDTPVSFVNFHTRQVEVVSCKKI